MNILIYDNDNLDRANLLGQNLRRKKAEIFVSSKGQLTDPDGNKAKTSPSVFDLVLWHKTNEKAFSAAKIKATCSISFSGGSQADIPRAFSATNGFTEKEASHIINTLDAERDDLKRHILNYWSPNYLTRAALRVMCEAWLLNKGKKEAEHAGIIVRAPIEPDDWFSPFGKEPGLKEASEIASKMIGVQGESGVLLKSIALLWDPKKGEATAPLSFEKFKTPVESFLQAFASPAK